MKQFEYKKIFSHELLLPHSTQIDLEKLNSLGLKGWELAVIASGEYIFKRETRKRVVIEL